MSWLGATFGPMRSMTLRCPHCTVVMRRQAAADGFECPSCVFAIAAMKVKLWRRSFGGLEDAPSGRQSLAMLGMPRYDAFLFAPQPDLDPATHRPRMRTPFDGVDRSVAPASLSGLALSALSEQKPFDVDSISVAARRIADADKKLLYSCRDAPPLDVEHDGVTLRGLLDLDEERRRGDKANVDHLRMYGRPFTPAQRDAISAHWSAQLRAKVAASAERERSRVVVDLQEVE